MRERECVNLGSGVDINCYFLIAIKVMSTAKIAIVAARILAVLVG